MHASATGYDYVELHAHSCWSLREGASSTDELIDRAIALGYPALALTDHDGVYGSMEFAKAARERGLRPITGVELTVLGDDGQPSHVTVLAAEVEGFRNISRILSLAYRTHGKDSPHVEKQWLTEHHEGLILLSGCRESELSRLLDPHSLARDPRLAEAVATRYHEAFGDRFYIELQDHDVFGDRERVATMAEFAAAHGIEIVATNNAHYHVRERHRLNDVLVAIHHRRTLDSSHEERRPNSEFFLKSGQAMARRFANYPRALSNTLVIAERCQFDLTRDLPYRLPDYKDLPDGATMDEFLKGVCERAFRRKYSPLTPAVYKDARERLDRELMLIARHGLAGFFLVYWEILQMVNEIAQEMRGRPMNLAPDERPVGRGRGSSVSSIVCYLIGLSHIDPVTNKLYLDRFLNDELHSLPDIDIDFPRDIRDEVLQRVYDRFGDDHAALVCSFPTYQFKSAVLDIGKTLGLPAPVLAKLNKLGGHFASAHDIADEMSHVPELQELVGAPIWSDLIELAHEVAGFPRHISQHVGGAIISADPISSVVPIEPARMSGRFVCQWDKDSVDDARFVKIDFLALGMLSAVDECLEIIEETRGVRVDLGRIDHDEKVIYDSIQAGDTMGVFQIESRAQVQTLPRTAPRNLDDLAVQVAIIRPGPIVAGAFHPYMEYRERLARGEPIEVDYGHPELGPLLQHCLGETLGHVLYQDQVLQISCAIAGFTPGQADRLRRAMSRKRSSEAMQALAAEFYEGAKANGVSRDAAAVAFEKMAAFASFGFPKSHAVAFALLAYESCWLRYYYGPEYYSALFNAQPMGFYSVEVLTGDANRHGYTVMPPSINISRAATYPEGDGIRLGFSHVKGLGGDWFSRRGLKPEERSQTVPEVLYSERANGPYRSLRDLVTRTRIDRGTAEILIRSGTLDEFGIPRRELLWQLGLLIPGESVLAKRVQQKATSSAQTMADAASGWPKKPARGGPRRGRTALGFQAPLPLPTDQDMAELPQLSPWQQLAWDYETMGVTGGGHPMAHVRPLLHEGMVSSLQVGGMGNDNRLPQGQVVEMAGMVVTRQRPQTASGVMFMLLEDEFGLTNVVIYRKLQEKQRELVRGTPFVIVRGRIDNEQSGFPNIIAESFRPCPLPGRIEAPDSHDFG